jgi:hypothetical protein
MPIMSYVIYWLAFDAVSEMEPINRTCQRAIGVVFASLSEGVNRCFSQPHDGPPHTVQVPTHH